MEEGENSTNISANMVFVDFLATVEEALHSDSVTLLETHQNQIYFGSDFPNIPYHLAHPIG